MRCLACAAVALALAAGARAGTGIDLAAALDETPIDQRFFGTPVTLLQSEWSVLYAFPPAGNPTIEDLRAEVVSTASSWDFDLGNISSAPEAQAMRQAYIADNPEADFVLSWFTVGGGEPPTFSVNLLTSPASPIPTLAPGESFTLFVNVTSATDIGDGVVGVRYVAGDPCPADLSVDGAVNATDLGVLLAAWGLDGPADLDASGAVDATDLGILLAAWGLCP